MPTKHDQIATRLAGIHGTEYNTNKGADVKAQHIAIEVETAESLNKDGFRQLQGHSKPVYVAGVDTKAVNAALERAKGTTVGVMDPDGSIVKRSPRG